MDWQKLQDLQHERGNSSYTDMDTLSEDLFEAGATPEDKAELVEYFDANADSLELGMEPHAIYWAFCHRFTQRIQEMERAYHSDRVRANLGRIRTIIEEVESKPSAGLDDLRKPADDIAQIAQEVREVYTPPKRALYHESMLDFGSTREIAIDYLNGLTIPSPGVTIIGGKAASGKTTALVNAARSFIEQGLSVAIFSYEQTKQDMALLMALSMMAKSRAVPTGSHVPFGPGERIEAPDDRHIADTQNILTDYNTALKRHIMEYGLPEFLEEPYEILGQAIDTGKLEVWDYYGDAGELAQRIENTSFDVYLIDYIQVIPAADGAAREGYQRIADISSHFRRLASTGEKTIVLGAQFNRQSGESRSADEFDPAMEQFREAADIEHLASLALGLGWYKTEDGGRQHYWKVLKHRYNGAARDARMFSGGHFRYAYVQPWSRWITPAEWPYGIEGAPERAENGGKGNGRRSSGGGAKTDDNLRTNMKGWDV
jgi:hypothetical protein